MFASEILFRLKLGVPPGECADNDGHNTDTIDALTLTVPVILKYADASSEERNRKVLYLTISGCSLFIMSFRNDKKKLFMSTLFKRRVFIFLG